MPHAGEGRVSRNRVSLGQSKGTGTAICEYSLVGVLVSFRDYLYFRLREVIWEYHFGIAGLCILVFLLPQLPDGHPQPLT